MNSFLQLADWLGTNPWLSIASFIIAVISVVLAIIFYSKSKKVKSPCYAIRSINIVRDLVSKIESLEMLFAGQPIENLTVTKIAFWNAGNDTINSYDIPIAEPLTVHIKKGYQILDAKILYSKNPANQFSISTSDDHSFVNLQFDYIDKEEGGVIQLIHTGTTDEDIEISGTIKGAGKLIKKYVPRSDKIYPSSQNKQPSAKSRKLGRYFLSILLFGLPLTIIANIFKGEINEIGELLFSSLIILVYWGFGYHIIKRRIPKGFDVFEEEF